MNEITPGEFRKKSGSFFTDSFLVIVDKKSGIVEINESCYAASPINRVILNIKHRS